MDYISHISFNTFGFHFIITLYIHLHCIHARMNLLLTDQMVFIQSLNVRKSFSCGEQTIRCIY